MSELNRTIEVIKANTNILDPERVPLQDSLGRVLAKDIISDIDMPPYNKSAMDGYACKRSDILKKLKIIEEIPAGKVPEKNIKTGQCAKIMTGAVIPDGANCVFKLEDSVNRNGNKIKCTNPKTKSNICYKAEDISIGDIVIKSATLIKPQHIAIMASVGCTCPVVYKQPKVAVVATGSEIVEPDKIPSFSQIRNSNSFQLRAQLSGMGIKGKYAGIVEDSAIKLNSVINDAVKNHDVVIITGGVSVGDHDLVPLILKELRQKILIEKNHIKPGKVFKFSIGKNGVCFGLSGNPVASFIQFELFVKPCLFKSMGYDYTPTLITGPLLSEYKCKKSDRLGLVPVAINSDGEIVPVEYHGSAHILAFEKAVGLMEIPAGVQGFKKGGIVTVRPI